VLGLLLGESVMLSLSGALVGSFGAKFVYSVLDLSDGVLIRRFDVSAATLLLCAGIGVFIGLVAAGPASWKAAMRPAVEPTGDLDAQSAHEVLEVLKTLNQDFQKTIIMVTHDPRAARYAIVNYYLEKGVLTQEGQAAGVR